jgi:hypothetical protein
MAKLKKLTTYSKSRRTNAGIAIAMAKDIGTAKIRVGGK